MVHSLRQVSCFQVGRVCRHSSFDPGAQPLNLKDARQSPCLTPSKFRQDFGPSRPLFAFHQPREPYEDDRRHKGHHNRADKSAGAEPYKPEYPAAHNPAKNSQKDVLQRSVSSPFYHLSRQPSRDKAHYFENQESSGLPFSL